MQELDGLIVKEQSGFYWIEAEDGVTYRCQLRGKLKEDAKQSDIAAIGDRVQFAPNQQEDGVDILTGSITHIHDRHNALSRAVRTTGKRGAGNREREHVLIANLDQAFLVFSAASPTPDLRLLDRLLVTTERSAIDDVVIVINKMDLDPDPDVLATLQPYHAMGYDVVYTSALDQSGIDALRTRLRDKISVFTGPSGVGKTSLLNRIQPGLGRTTKSISQFSQEGVHTTRDSALIKVAGGYLADTPGIRYLNIWDVEPEELDAYFVDIADYVSACKFSNCTHTSEPRCAVKQAVADGDIAARRYQQYRQLRDELMASILAY